MHDPQLPALDAVAPKRARIASLQQQQDGRGSFTGASATKYRPIRTLFASCCWTRFAISNRALPAATARSCPASAIEPSYFSCRSPPSQPQRGRERAGCCGVVSTVSILGIRFASPSCSDTPESASQLVTPATGRLATGKCAAAHKAKASSDHRPGGGVRCRGVLSFETDRASYTVWCGQCATAASRFFFVERARGSRTADLKGLFPGSNVYRLVHYHVNY